MISQDLIRDLAAYQWKCRANAEIQDDSREGRFASGCMYGAELCVRVARLASDVQVLRVRFSMLATEWSQKTTKTDAVRGDAFVLGVCSGISRAQHVIASHAQSEPLEYQP